MTRAQVRPSKAEERWPCDSESESESAGAGDSAGASDRDSAPDYRKDRTTGTAPERVDPTTPAAEGHHGAILERPERYKVQFTATEEYVRLVDEAKALLSHAVPNVTLEELQMRAMRALVAELKKKKYATKDSSSARARDPEPADALPQATSRTRRERTNALEQAAEQPHTRRRGRHIPAVVRRTVFERDGDRCSYIDANGTRCSETHRLEFHHLKPFALGGDHRASNLTLRCSAHNALAAEEDFGRELIQDRKNSLQHEPFSGFRGDERVLCRRAPAAAVGRRLAGARAAGQRPRTRDVRRRTPRGQPIA